MPSMSTRQIGPTTCSPRPQADSGQTRETDIAPKWSAVADRGGSGSWGPLFCGALCKGVTHRFPAGVAL